MASAWLKLISSSPSETSLRPVSLPVTVLLFELLAVPVLSSEAAEGDFGSP